MKIEQARSLTPLKRIPINRGTPVKHNSELNPISKKEIKNIIKVYSEANDAYYTNFANNIKKKKHKLKKKVSKKNANEKFDPLSMNPLTYRNKKIEKNERLLHIPGVNITPEYTPQNANSQYAVTSMPYKTLHSSNPLAWGRDYQKHYELPTICSIVKSKHPLYTKPNNNIQKAKYIKQNKNKTENKKTYSTNTTTVLTNKKKKDQNFKIFSAPTFGNIKENSKSPKSLKNNNGNDENSNKRSDNDTCTNLNYSSDSEKGKNNLDDTYDSSDNYKCTKGDKNNSDSTFKNQNDVKYYNGDDNIEHKKLNNQLQMDDLNFNNAKIENSDIYIQPNNSLYINTLHPNLELKVLNTPSISEYNSNNEREDNVSRRFNCTDTSCNYFNNKSHRDSSCKSLVTKKKEKRGICNKKKITNSNNVLNCLTKVNSVLHRYKGDDKNTVAYNNKKNKLDNSLEKNKSKTYTRLEKKYMQTALPEMDTKKSVQRIGNGKYNKSYNKNKQLEKKKTSNNNSKNKLKISTDHLYSAIKNEGSNQDSLYDVIRNNLCNFKNNSKVKSKNNEHLHNDQNVTFSDILEPNKYTKENYNFFTAESNIQTLSKNQSNVLYETYNSNKKDIKMTNDINNVENLNTPTNMYKAAVEYDNKLYSSPIYTKVPKGANNTLPIISSLRANNTQTMQNQIQQSQPNTYNISSERSTIDIPIYRLNAQTIVQQSPMSVIDIGTPVINMGTPVIDMGTPVMNTQSPVMNTQTPVTSAKTSIVGTQTNGQDLSTQASTIAKPIIYDFDSLRGLHFNKEVTNNDTLSSSMQPLDKIIAVNNNNKDNCSFFAPNEIQHNVNNCFKTLMSPNSNSSCNNLNKSLNIYENNKYTGKVPIVPIQNLINAFDKKNMDTNIK
ncbi:conserved protein, unknown function, partial [Hepatocystis sp. ex Piliocolobus tephrosceles]